MGSGCLGHDVLRLISEDINNCEEFLCGDKTIYDVNFECIQDEIYVLAVGSFYVVTIQIIVM